VVKFNQIKERIKLEFLQLESPINRPLSFKRRVLSFRYKIFLEA
jgi:hypothetical protein